MSETVQEGGISQALGVYPMRGFLGSGRGLRRHREPCSRKPPFAIATVAPGLQALVPRYMHTNLIGELEVWHPT